MIKHITKRNILFSLIFSLFFTLCYSIGYKLEEYQNIFYFKNDYIRFLLCFILTFLSYFLLKINSKKITYFLSKIKVWDRIENQFLKPTPKCYFSCFIFIAVFNSFCLMAHFPGIVAYDFLYQVAFFDFKMYSEVHPLIHNAIIYLIYFLNKQFNSDFIGALFHSLFQSAIMISIFSYCIYFLAKHKVSSIIKFLTLLYFAFYPIHQVLMITTTKDVIFSGLVLLFSIQLIELSLKQKEFMQSKANRICFIAIIFLLLSFRLNALSAYILSLPFILFFFKKDIKKVLILFLLPIFLFGIFEITKKAFGIKKGPVASFLSVPLQQMGRVRLKYKDSLSEKDKLSFRNIVSQECELKYNPYSVDPIKIQSHMYIEKTQTSEHIEKSFKENPKNFYDLYFKWLKEYPKDYINAFLLTNFTHWYPNAKYSKIYNYLNHEPSSLFVVNKSYFNFYPGMTILDKSLNPYARLYYNLLFRYNNFEKNDFLFVFFSYAWNLWFLILNFFLLLNAKKYKYLIIFALPFSLVFSVLFGPTALLRYVYYNYLILPIVLAFNFGKFKK